MCIFLPEKQTGSKPKANQKQTGNKKEKEIEIEIEFEIELELELELEGEGDNGCYPLVPPYGERAPERCTKEHGTETNVLSMQTKLFSCDKKRLTGAKNLC